MELDANDLIQAVVSQRNAALDEAAKLSAMVQKLTRDNAALELELSKSKAEDAKPAPDPAA